jgi:hypothetical protein
MQRRRPAPPREAILTLPVQFKVGEHALSISFVSEGRWTVSVDGGPPSRTYQTQVEAWEAGVRTADEKDRMPRA